MFRSLRRETISNKNCWAYNKL